MTVDDLDLVVLHQANIRILDAAAEQLGIDRQKMFVNLDRYGNTSAGSIPLALDEAIAGRPHSTRRSGAGQRLRRRPGLGHGDHRVVGIPSRRLVFERPGRFAPPTLAGVGTAKDSFPFPKDTSMTSTAVKTASKVKALPKRSQVKPADTWDLSSLFADDAAWETAFDEWERPDRRLRRLPGQAGRKPPHAGRLPEVRRRLRPGRRAAGNLRLPEDGRRHRQQQVPADARPLPARRQPGGPGGQLHPPGDPGHSRPRSKKFLAAKALAAYRLLLERMLRYKPHTLRRSEENLLAMQTEMAEAANQIFRQLNDADLKFGTIKNERGEWSN